MTFYVIKWREGEYNSWDMGGYEVANSVEGTGETIRLIEKYYNEALKKQLRHKPYIIDGKKIDLMDVGGGFGMVEDTGGYVF